MNCLYVLLFALLELTLANPVFKSLPPVGVAENLPRNIVILNSWNVLENPDEISGQFEGDIVLTDIQAREIAGLNRNGRIDTYYRWKDNTVYYQITNDFDAAQKDYILKALQNISESAPNCIKFKQRTNEIDYVEVIGSGSGCYSFVGRQGGKQQLNLQTSPTSYTKPGAGCLRRAIIMHEFLHVLGFYHMQSSSDRDNFVTINFNNIEDGKSHNFVVYGSNVISNYSESYDITSVLHYGPTAFSKDGRSATIIARPDISPNIVSRMGQRDRMSDSDIRRLQNMYSCKK